VQAHEHTFEVEATPEEVWRALHPRLRLPADGGPLVIEHGSVRIEIVDPGDEDGKGLVRRCWFRVPRYLLSGGVGQSFEVVTVSRPPVHSRYEAVGKPLWSKAAGWHRLEELGGGRTRVTFGEEYEAFNPLARRLLERRVHRFISKDNDALLRAAVEAGVAAQRRRKDVGSAGIEPATEGL
jgi:hypothetical protein